MHITLILLFFGGIIMTIGDIVMKEWVLHSTGKFYFGGLIFYLIGLVFLAQSYKREDIAVASVILIIFNVVSLSLVGYFVFKENITVYEIIGIVLGIAAMIFLELGKKF